MLKNRLPFKGDVLMKTIVAIDGDLLAFRCSAACERRYIVVTHKSSGNIKEFPTKTEFWGHWKKKDGGWLAEQNKKRKEPFTPDDFTIEEKREGEDIANALHAIKQQIKSIVKLAEADDYEIYLSGDTNFRDRLPLPTKYKSNRDDLARPVHLEQCRQYLKDQHKAIVADDVEADDMLVWRAMLAKNSKTEKIIVASLDKDNRQAFSTYLLDWTKENPKVELLPEFGRLWLNDKGEVKFEGRLGMYYQMIFGDPVDFYKPCELAGEKFGEKSAYAILKDCEDDYDALQAVHDTYKKWYPDPVVYTAWDGTEQTKSYLDLWQLYCDCVVMKRSPTYKYELRKILKYAGIA